jgi:rod shape-determining protein MreC
MEYIPPPLFKQGPSARAKLIVFVMLSVGLLTLDAKFGAMELVRKVVGTLLYPLQTVARAPVELSRAAVEYAETVSSLQTENERLRKKQLADQEKLYELQTVKSENTKLRKLLDIAKTLQVKASILTEVISDANDPFSRKIVINKGSIQNIKEGMPVIDELGLLGQVTRVYPARSEVSLITDKEQIIPVENLRNGLRSVAYGGLDGGLLELRFMAPNSDVEMNDQIVTSGLDGVYPRGIPVAKVLRVERNSRYAFASIFCEPIAGVDRHRFLLVLDTAVVGGGVETEPAKKPEATQPGPSKPATVKTGQP